MKLFAYGDSWTEGCGINPSKEILIENKEERKYFRNSKAWPKVLSSLLGLDHQNEGIAGTNNNTIFNKVIENVKSGKIREGDLAIVMWSSSLRDDVPFFPEGEWRVWGLNYIKPKHKDKWFISNEIALTKNPSYNQFLIDFKNVYINDLFTRDYYNIINQNYILFLQHLFNFYKINYIFCDGFDKMIDGIKKENDKTYLIDQSCYWKLSKKTLKDLLIDTEDKLVWEDPKYDIKEIPGMHPSELGYELIASEIYNFIDINRKDIIKHDNTPKRNKIL
jgi:lysophospholipase L1-like esterase